MATTKTRNTTSKPKPKATPKKAPTPAKAAAKKVTAKKSWRPYPGACRSGCRESSRQYRHRRERALQSDG